jgi:GNAT superfamily N-acetyltransferase
MVRIRQGDQHDYRACLDCVPGDWRSAAFEARLGVQVWKDYIFVAEDDGGTVLGYLACDSEFFDADGFYLRTLVVRDSGRQNGVGEALLREATSWAFSRGVRRVFTDVVTPMLAKTLERGGFERVGEIRHMHAEDAVFMIYSLKAGATIVDPAKRHEV